jgi:hypothetical protein
MLSTRAPSLPVKSTGKIGPFKIPRMARFPVPVCSVPAISVYQDGEDMLCVASQPKDMAPVYYKSQISCSPKTYIISLVISSFFLIF